MRFAKWAFILVFCIYLLALLFVYLTQRSFQYFPTNVKPDNRYLQANNIKPIMINVHGVGNIKSFYREAQPDRPFYIFFHGNASSAYNILPNLLAMSSESEGFLAVAYPAYDGNHGRVTEKNILKTALSAYDNIIKQGVKPEQIIVHGESLGASAGIYLAAHRKIAGLALSAPFYSMQSMARKQMPYFPTSILLKDTWRSDKWIKNVKAPVLIMHGNKDNIIPHSQSKDLYEIYEGKKSYHLIKGGRHSLWNTEMPKLVQSFANEQVK